METVDFDKKHGLEMIKVPAHGQQIEEVEVLKDLRMVREAIMKYEGIYFTSCFHLFDIEDGLYREHTGLQRDGCNRNSLSSRVSDI